MCWSSVEVLANMISKLDSNNNTLQTTMNRPLKHFLKQKWRYRYIVLVCSVSALEVYFNLCIDIFLGIGQFFPKDGASNEDFSEKPQAAETNSYPGASSEELGLDGVKPIHED